MRIVLIFAITHLLFAAHAEGTTDILPDGVNTYTISASGSYLLSGNVTMMTPAVCIDVTADDVTIDLNGHTITGFPGGGNCIDTKNNSRLRVSNGTVANFGGTGIFTAQELTATDLTVRNCGGSGISAGISAEIRNVLAVSNQGYGIGTGDFALIESCRVLGNGKIVQPGGTFRIAPESRRAKLPTVRLCIVRSNSPSTGSVRAHGILTGDNCTIIGNTASGNNGGASANGIGIKGGAQCVISDNTASENVGAGRAIGIDAGSGSTISGNTCFGNSATLGGNGHGINAVDFCVIRQNSCTFNEEGSTGGGEAFGILAGNSCIVEGNTCSVNRAVGADGTGHGIKVESGCSIRGNVCNQNTGNGTGTAYGIFANSGATIENNTCSGHGANPGRPGYGIFVVGPSNVIRANSTFSNLTAGIRLDFVGSRTELNRTKDGVSAAAGTSLGVGDLADIAF